ncbi:MAG: NINE protein [Burkholderiaceae bacterium]
MPVAHKNKTFATLLASLFGGAGAHRFYLFGKKDLLAWVYVLSWPLSALAGYFVALAMHLNPAPLLLCPLSIFAGFIAALIIGLTPDQQWDARHNPRSSRQSNSGWAVILIVIATFFFGTTLLIAAIARSLDLLLTGGAYG